jgi:hypothetical protein
MNTVTVVASEFVDDPRNQIITFVAIGPLCYGYADVTLTRTAEQARIAAIKMCKRNAPSAMTIHPGKHVIKLYEITGMTGMSESGTIMTTKEGTCKELPESFLIVRKR